MRLIYLNLVSDLTKLKYIRQVHDLITIMFYMNYYF